MNPFVPAPDTARVEDVMIFDGEYVENVYHVLGAGGGGVSLLTQCAEAFANFISFHERQTQTSRAQHVMLRVTDISQEDGPGIEYTSAFPLLGTVTGGEMYPNNVTVCIKWATGYRGRSFRGRTYHVGLSSQQCSGQALSTEARAAMLTAYGWLLTDCLPVGMQLAVCSRFHNNAPRTTAVVTPILSVSIDPTLDSQRRRLPGRGR